MIGTTLGSIAGALRLTWGAARGRLVLTGCLAALGAALPAVTLWLTRDLVDGITRFPPDRHPEPNGSPGEGHNAIRSRIALFEHP